jgi:O-acetyl-ADP-ribose deacetylase (regulator of RNase III)
MSNPSERWKTSFSFGRTTVRILQGDILDRGNEQPVDIIVSSDDNYMTMAGGVSRRLREQAGLEYARTAQANCPVGAGTIIANDLGQIPANPLNARYVFHAAIIDYDSEDQSLQEVVVNATINCLDQAERMGLPTILFPALGSGIAGLSMYDCAQSMCMAIKTYLAEERAIDQITILLHYAPTGAGNVSAESLADRNAVFIREANLIFNVPYDPALGLRQVRDFYPRQDLMERLEALLTCQVPGKRHAVILGGPQVGKWSLLEQLHFRARQPGSPLSAGRKVYKVTFGRIFDNTSAEFVYRKFLLEMWKQEEDPQAWPAFQSAYANLDMNCDRFLGFLDEHTQRYPEVVFLVDNLPFWIKADPDPSKPGDLFVFWRDLECLNRRVRFFFTTRKDERFESFMEQPGLISEAIKREIETILVACISETEAADWVERMFRRYIDLPANEELPLAVQTFAAEEGGRHPYLISLICHHLVERLQRLERSTLQNRAVIQKILQQARGDQEEPRHLFFNELMEDLTREQQVDLQNLARAVALDEQRRLLIQASGDPNTPARLMEIQDEGDPREFLHPEILRDLKKRGYLVNDHAAERIQDWNFMSRTFAGYVLEKLGGRKQAEDRPVDVTISILQKDSRQIRTLFDGQSAQVIASEKPLTAEIKAEFLRSFGQFLENRIRPGGNPAKTNGSGFQDAEEVGNFILTQFTTTAVKRYLDNPPKGCTISFLVDQAYKEIPWELMLEAVYAGEIPFRVGRSIVSPQPPQNIRPPARGQRQVKALLIGDPRGDLQAALDEVQYVAEALGKDGRFAAPEVMMGQEQCRRIRVLNALSSGRFGLVHYSGHTVFAGESSAWNLADGDLTTDMLTNAVQMAPPALVISSSCSSAAAGKARRPRYEDQTFDLPGAFLQAGVEAYLGSLWEVDASASRLFVEKFYNAFLSGEHNLGECLRLARWALKQQEERQGLVNWLAYILYCDPHTLPVDLFPALQVLA